MHGESLPDPDVGDGTGTPLWVKAFGTIVLPVALLFLILVFFRGHWA